jgi:diamine N-acetyltransferase
VKPGNERARRAYAAVGFAEEGVLRDALRTEDGYESLILMSILAPDWEAGRRESPR